MYVQTHGPELGMFFQRLFSGEMLTTRLVKRILRSMRGKGIRKTV